MRPIGEAAHLDTSDVTVPDWAGTARYTPGYLKLGYQIGAAISSRRLEATRTMLTSGKTILVTGGSAGIGLALAKAFVNAGNRVVVCGRNLKALESARAEVPELEAMQCDIASEQSVSALAARYSSDVDILVNNAGVCQTIDLTKPNAGLADQLSEVDINLLGALRMLHAFLPGLQRRSSAAVVNVTSALAFIPSADYPIYCATKAAMHSLTLSLRHQLRATSVRVFELVPPLTDTTMATRGEGITMLSPDAVARALLKGMGDDCFEIAPGLSRATRWMSRIAPRFGFRQLNR